MTIDHTKFTRRRRGATNWVNENRERPLAIVLVGFLFPTLLLSLGVFGGHEQLIFLIWYALSLLFGTLAVVLDVRAGNRREAVGWVFFTAFWLTGLSSAPTEGLTSTLHRWSILLFWFGGSVYLGMYGWEKLRREPLVTLAVRYSLAGLFGSLILYLVFINLLPRQFQIIPFLTWMVTLAGVIAGGAWIVKKRPWILSDELWKSSLALFFSVGFLISGSFNAYDEARRWLAF